MPNFPCIFSQQSKCLSREIDCPGMILKDACTRSMVFIFSILLVMPFYIEEKAAFVFNDTYGLEVKLNGVHLELNIITENILITSSIRNHVMKFKKTKNTNSICIFMIYANKVLYS